MLSECIERDPELTVIGTASNGRLALEKVAALKPDVVVLDLDMPQMDGLETLVRLRNEDQKSAVIAFSTITLRGARATLDALAKGASDYVTKPSSVAGGKSALEIIRDELLPKLRLFGRASKELRTSNALLSLNDGATVGPVVRVTPKKHALPPKLLVMGTSTGGPNALTEVLAQLPKPFPLPILIVQHMPPIFTSIFAERLAANTGHDVFECGNDTHIESGKVWIAPGDFHMVVTKAPTGPRLQTHKGDPENSCRPAVDVLFRSAADVYRNGVLAIILTGMGSDGLKGCRKIVDMGGSVVVQVEQSSVVWGMPGYVAKAGLADAVRPLGSLYQEIVRRLK